MLSLYVQLSEMMSSLQQCARRFLWMRRIPGFHLWNRLFYKREHPALARELFGIPFQHPVGLAPVLERQADLLDEFESIGFSFVGLIPGETPLKTVAQRIQNRQSRIVVSVELRADGSSEEQAKKKILRQFSLLYDFTDLFTIDINRESGLSSLDDVSDWTELLDEILSLRLCYEKYRPILLRISPTHTEEQMKRILDFCLLSGFDGVVAPGISKVRFCVNYTKDRLPVIPTSSTRLPDNNTNAALNQTQLSVFNADRSRTTSRAIHRQIPFGKILNAGKMCVVARQIQRQIRCERRVAHVKRSAGGEHHIRDRSSRSGRIDDKSGDRDRIAQDLQKRTVCSANGGEREAVIDNVRRLRDDKSLVRTVPRSGRSGRIRIPF